MHLNILLNRINWRKIGEIAFATYVLLTICCVTAYAEEAQVIIETGATTYSDAGLAVDVTVKFEDMSLYSDQVYLSYHIVDENGESLLFENQRLPFDPKAAFTTVYVDCANLEELAGRDAVVIQFDLVDEANVYWFSDNSSITFQAASIVFDWQMVQSSLQQPPVQDEEIQIESNPNIQASIFSGALNIFAWVMLAGFVCLFISTRNNMHRHKQNKGDEK